MELIKLLGVLNRNRWIRAETGFNPHYFPGPYRDRDCWRTWSGRTSGNNRYKLCSEQKYGNLYHDPAGYRYTGKKRSA